MGEILEPIVKAFNGTFIHSHPYEIPLSAADVKLMLGFGSKKNN